MDISIIIINYNTYQLACNCIESVLQHTKGCSFEIILIENGTAQFDESKIALWGENVKLIVSENNLGFAGGNNLGIEQAKGDFVLLLNSDVYLKENTICSLFHFMESRKEIGAASPRLVYPDGRVQSIAQRFPSAKYKLIEKLRIQKLMPKHSAGKVLLGAFFDHEETTEADWVWAAFMMIRKEVINKMPNKKLDESYFMYWEDVQWCMDIKNLGYKIFFYGDAEAIHIHEGSKANKSNFLAKNEQLFLNKNYSNIERTIIRILD